MHICCYKHRVSVIWVADDLISHCIPLPFLSCSSIKMAEEARGICVRDVKADAFIAEYAEHLKNSDKFELPVWSDTVKTACFKELAPYGDDWYYIRAASIARKVYLRPGVGVGMLRKWY